MSFIWICIWNGFPFCKNPRIHCSSPFPEDVQVHLSLLESLLGSLGASASALAGGFGVVRVVVG